ncbi:hypothetical protein [Taibaiella soli]|nr:hypothetical protein [Taibaiella soli]
MKQENPANNLRERLAAKKSQQAQFQKVISQYNYALMVLDKEINKLTQELSCSDKSKRKWYYSNDWDIVIADIIATAGCPLTREEIEETLMASNLIPDNITNPKQYMYQKILHAQKRDVIFGYHTAGSRRLYYSLPSWIDEFGNIREEMTADNSQLVN